MGERMENGRTEEVIRQFDAISALPDAWGHNEQYHGYLLGKLPRGMEAALDVGCGRGGFSRLLARDCPMALGIDVSPGMVREAAKRAEGGNPRFLQASAEDHLSGVTEAYDAIACIAVLHHMDAETFFRDAKRALKPGGVLAVLDLYRPASPIEHFLSALAVPANLLYGLVKRGRLGATKEEKQAWREHSKSDSYETTRAIGDMAARILGPIELKRHLFWRYSLIYVKPRSAQ